MSRGRLFGWIGRTGRTGRSGRTGRTGRRSRMGRAATVAWLAKRVAVGLALLVTLAPLYLILTTSLKDPAIAFRMPPQWLFVPTLEHYRAVLQDGDFLRSYANSLLVVGGSVGVAMLAGVPAGYALARHRFRGRSALAGLFLGSRLFPQITIVVPVFVIFAGMGLLNTHIGLVLVYTQLNLGLVVWMTRGYVTELPEELEEAAAIDGASRLRTLTSVVLPLTAPGIAATAILAVVFAWNEFLFALAIGGSDTRLATVGIYEFMQYEQIAWGQLHAAGTLIMLPILLFALLVQRHIVSGLVSGIGR